MFGADLIPHASSAPNNIGVRYDRIESIHNPPVLIDPVVDAIDVVVAGVEIDDVVVGEDDLALPARQFGLVELVAPPVDHVFVLHRQVDLLVGPVDHLLRRTYLGPEQSLLLLPVVDRQSLVVSYAVGLHELLDGWALVPAAQQHLVSAEVDVVVLEDVGGVVDDLGNCVPGQVHGWVELAHVFAVAVQSDVLVGWVPAP